MLFDDEFVAVVVLYDFGETRRVRILRRSDDALSLELSGETRTKPALLFFDRREGSCAPSDAKANSVTYLYGTTTAGFIEATPSIVPIQREPGRRNPISRWR